MIKVSWQDHFKDSLAGAEEAYAKASSFSAGTAGSFAKPAFLTYCLQNEIIASREYLEWAKEAHQLPVLMDEFFVAHPAPVDLFKAHQHTFTWNNGCLPVAEWDGILMVACLEIPEDFPSDRPAAFLLASPALLEQTWQFIATSLSVEESPAQQSASQSMEDLLGDLSSAPKSLFDANGELVLKDEPSASEGSNPAIEVSAEASEEASGMPEGLFAETVVDSTALTSFAMDHDAKTKMSTEILSVETLDEAPIAEAVAPAESEIKVSLGVSLGASIGAAASTASAPVKGPRTVEPLASLPVMEDSLSAVTPETPKFETPKFEAPATPAAPTPAASAATGSPPNVPMKPSAASATSAAYLLEKMRKQNPEVFEAEVQASFKKMKPYFKKAMFLAVGDKDRVIKPLIWDENFQAPANGQPEFDLRTPSFFRIVSTTQKPYHGFVVPNDFNESFFESWNQGQVPDHITMVPFMDGDLVIGMILGIGEKSSYNRQVLQFTESVSRDLAATLGKSSSGNTRTNVKVA